MHSQRVLKRGFNILPSFGQTISRCVCSTESFWMFFHWKVVVFMHIFILQSWNLQVCANSQQSLFTGTKYSYVAVKVSTR